MAIDSPKDRSLGSWEGWALAIVVLIAAYWLVSSLVGSGDAVAGVRATGPLHLAADGRLIFTDFGTGGTATDGRVVALDIASNTSTVLLDDLAQPLAADLSPAGVTCAVTQGNPDRPTMLVCGDGLRVDLDAYVRRHPGPAGLPRLGQPAYPADLVSDGGNGWYVAEVNTSRVLLVAGDGTIAVVATMREHPVGLSLDAGSLWIALGESGIAGVPVETRDGDIGQGQWVGGGVSIAVAPRRSVPLVLVRESNDVHGFVTYQVGVDAAYPRVVDGLVSPTGLAFLPDGRLAVAADGRLILFRPRSLP